MILVIPLNAVLMKRLRVYHKINMSLKDKRIKVMNEILQGIRIIKYFAWENSYSNKVNEIRNTELVNLRTASYLRVVIHTILVTTPLFVTLVTFATYSLTGKFLTAEIAFTSLSLFYVLRYFIYFNYYYYFFFIIFNFFYFFIIFLIFLIFLLLLLFFFKLLIYYFIKTPVESTSTSY